MLRNTILVAIDCGKSDTKVCVLTNDQTVIRDSFPTAYGTTKNKGIDLIPGVHTFSCPALGEEVYTIGSTELPEKPDNEYSKNKPINKICTLYAIAKHVQNGDVVYATIGCPIATFENKEERDEYCRNILPKGMIRCAIDGKEVYFSIEKRLVGAEAIGLRDLHPEFFSADKDTAIVDIGGLNMNMTSIHNGIIVIEDSYTTRDGGRRLINEVQAKLINNEIEISEQQVVDAIKRGYVLQHDEAKQKLSEGIIADAVNSFIDDIEAVLQKRWKNYDSLELFFTGGTSFLLREALVRRFGKFGHFAEDYESSRFANAEGFLRRLMSKLASDADRK